MPITERQIRKATWVKGFEHKEFRAYTTDLAVGFVLLFDNGVKKYRIKGKGETDSLSQAVRWWNDKEEQERDRTGYAAPGSVESLRALRSKDGLR